MIERYSVFKQSLGEITGMTEDLIHVHVGLAIFVVAALLLRRRMRSPLPILAVVLLALANEIFDWLAGPWDPLEGVLDFVNSVFWPAVLFLLAQRGHAPQENRVGDRPADPV